MEKQPLLGTRQEHHHPNSCIKLVCEVILISLASVSLLVDVIVNILARVSDATKFGFLNQTGDIETQVTPAGWVFPVMWWLIYAWQAVWLLYGWTFVCRPSTRRPIFWGVYSTFVLVCATNIAWLYTWGNQDVKLALAFVVLLALSLYGAVSILSYHLYRKTAVLEEEGARCDLWLARIIVVNGLAIFATWVTVVMCLNIGVVIQSSGHSDVELSEGPGSGSGGGGSGSGGGLNSPLDADAGTVTLALLALLITVYFVLENTVLDRFARFVLVVYPTVIWVLAGILAQLWNKYEHHRNQIFAAIFFVVVVILGCVRVVLLILFACVRPVGRREKLEYV